MSMTYLGWISLSELNWVKCGTQYKLPAQGYICLEDNLDCNLSALIQETFLKGRKKKKQQKHISRAADTVFCQRPHCIHSAAVLLCTQKHFDSSRNPTHNHVLTLKLEEKPQLQTTSLGEQ